MTQELLLGLLTFAFVTSVTPGPNNIMLMASGANFGWLRTVPHMLGVGIGFVLLCVLVGAGILQLFLAYPFADRLLKALAVAFMAWLAWKIANAAPPRTGGGAEPRPMTFLQAALFQWVNPKAWAMALSATAAYRPVDWGLGGVLFVALVFGLINLPTINIWVLLGTRIRGLLDVRWKLRAFNLTMAAALLASLYPILTARH